MENTANNHMAHDPGPNDSQTKLTSEANAPGRRQSSDKESTLVESSPGLEYPESPVPERRNDGQAMYMEYSEEDGDEKQEPEYLKSWKLVLVMTGISLVIFCMSLVCSLGHCTFKRLTDFNWARTIRFWRPRFPRLQISSTLWVMSVGMEVPTC